MNLFSVFADPTQISCALTLQTAPDILPIASLQWADSMGICPKRLMCQPTHREVVISKKQDLKKCGV